MSDIAEGIGGAIEGALAGRAVEPKHGEAAASSPELDPQDCPNCGTSAATAFCPTCGQKRKVHRSLSAIFHDLIHGVLHLDGKFWLTLPLLVFKPGKLTRRYIDGERAKFVSPMAMFLFSVFAMFAVFQLIGISTPTDLSSSTMGETIAGARASVDSDLADARERAEQAAPGSPELSQAMNDIQAAEQAQNGLDRATMVDFEANPDFKFTGIEALDEGLIKKWRQNPGLMLYKLQANGYKFSWLLIPLSIPFVWLMFAWRRQFKAYDHAIFVTYSLGFMSLLFIAMSLIGVSPLGGGWAFLAFAIIAPLHLYKHLKYTYGLNRFGAFWRFVVLTFCINVVLILFLQALLLLGAF